MCLEQLSLLTDWELKQRPVRKYAELTSVVCLFKMYQMLRIAAGCEGYKKAETVCGTTEKQLTNTLQIIGLIGSRSVT